MNATRPTTHPPPSGSPRPTVALPAPPRLRLPDRVVDGAIVAGLGVLYAGLLATAFGPAHRWHLGLSVQSAALALAAVPLLWWRRRWPLQVLAAMATIQLFADNLQPVVLFALYSAACRVRRPVAIEAAGATALALLLGRRIGGDLVGPGQLLAIALAVATATGIGLYIGERRAYLAALRERAAHVQRERELQAAQAVAGERVRIARELHDVVAHHVSLMVVQAGALEETLADPTVRNVAASIGTTGRSALAEMRRLLGVLRAEPAATAARPGGAGNGAALEPQPGLADLDRLLAQTRAAGVPVEVEVHGEPRPLPPGVDLSAYRIVQEALTNVIKHAGPARAEVALRYRPGALDLVVADDGRGAAGTPASGHGLLGMQERAELFGGELTARGVPGGGFRVRAVLPVHGTPESLELQPAGADPWSGHGGG